MPELWQITFTKMIKILPGNLLITNKETNEMYLCKVVGTPPLLDIIVGINISTFYKNGDVVKIGPKSPIITEIKANPYGYTFEDGFGIITIKDEVEEILNASKVINIRDKDIMNYRNMILEHGQGADTKFKFSLMKNGYTSVESDSILKQVKHAIKGI